MPAIYAREILPRTSPWRPGEWLYFLVASVCLAFSALYELIEWILAEVTEAEDFLGTQGDRARGPRGAPRRNLYTGEDVNFSADELIFSRMGRWPW